MTRPIKKGSGRQGSRVVACQVLRGWKPGEVWALLRDPTTQELLDEFPIITLKQDEVVELSFEIRKEEGPDLG